MGFFSEFFRYPYDLSGERHLLFFKAFSSNQLAHNDDSVHFGQGEATCFHPYPSHSAKNPFLRKYEFDYFQPFNFTKGEELGYFKMGSTVVCVFEESSDLQWTVKIGDKIKYGDSFCSI
jgi:hypothetical protein